MSMLQLLGGVAAAGVIAAGATAFTASGVTKDAAVTPAKLFLGGSLTATVTGTVIDNVTYTFTDAGTNTQLNAINLHFADTNSNNGLVTLTTTGSGAQPTWTCPAISAQATICTASVDYDLTANTLTDMSITVAPA